MVRRCGSERGGPELGIRDWSGGARPRGRDRDSATGAALAARGRRGGDAAIKARAWVFGFSAASEPAAIMREIVHIQAGQCGNQIGAKVRPPALRPGAE